MLLSPSCRSCWPSALGVFGGPVLVFSVLRLFLPRLVRRLLIGVGGLAGCGTWIVWHSHSAGGTERCFALSGFALLHLLLADTADRRA
jgi:hypothetical protein